ncbi:SGNH/GDSL hydrolase family protein, partial [Pseudomonas helleri]
PAKGFNLWLRPKAGTCTLYGIDTQKATGHRVHKLGATGSSAAQWATQTATTTWKACLAALAPNLVSIMLATNDQTGSTAPWIFGGYIETIIANVRAALPLADIAILMPPENQRRNNVKMAAYSSVVRDLCARLNVAFCDLQQDYGANPEDYAATSARNWYSADLIHPNPSTDGGLPIAARVLKLVEG